MKSLTGRVKANERSDGEIGDEGLVVADFAGRSFFSTDGVIIRGRGAYRIST